MKRLLLSIAVALALFSPLSVKAGAEQIDAFKAEYKIRQDGVIEATETIDYNFGSTQRHGIYRYIPYKYTTTTGGTEYLNISNISVKNANGYSYRYEKSTEERNVILKIGDKNKTVTGPNTYVISYNIKGGLRYFDDADEFYWNVNGTGWNVPIKSTEAKVVSEKPLSQGVISTDCYTGSYGENKNCSFKEIEDSSALFREGELPAGGNLTIVFRTPSGTYPVVSAGVFGSGISEKVFKLIIISALLIPLATFFIMLRHYWKWGRDPKGRGPIVVEYEPPKGMTPIEMGTLLDFRVDNKDISAEIIYLATKGYLKIRREEGKGMFKKDDYTLIKLKDIAEDGYDKKLLYGLFAIGSEVKVSEITDFYSYVQDIKSKVHTKLVENGYFKESIAATIGIYVLSGLGVAIGGFLLSLAISIFTNSVILVAGTIAFIASGFVVLIFGLFMPARTAVGVAAKEKVLGFKKYLSAVEAEIIKMMNAPKKDPAKFEEYLPFAMVFGVEKQWAKQFEGVYEAKPSWYEDPTGRVFAPMVFASAVSDFSAVTTTSAIAPSSSSGGGGGGFSGGGFGGGGGGSW